MSLYDRDYMRAEDWDSYEQSGGSGLGWVARVFGLGEDYDRHPAVVTCSVLLLAVVFSGFWHLVANNFFRNPPSLWEVMMNPAYYEAQFVNNLTYLHSMYVHLTLAEDSLDAHRYYSVLTYPLLHLSVVDLLFRLIGLLAFGVRLESYWGARKTALVMATCTLAGAAVYLVFETDRYAQTLAIPEELFRTLHGLLTTGEPAWGLAGVVFGLATAALVQFPKARVFELPIPVGIAALVYATIDLFGVVNFQGIAPPYGLIAAGALCGGAFGLWGRLRGWWACRQAKSRRPRRKGRR